jgi:hypothetical protein
VFAAPSTGCLQKNGAVSKIRSAADFTRPAVEFKHYFQQSGAEAQMDKLIGI